MTTADEITITADPDLVFRLAENIAERPRIFPHFRWVRILGQTSGGRVAEIAARRGVIPMRWIVVQTLDIRKRRIHYRHIDGAAKGLEVTWRIEPTRDGARVSVTHDLRLKHPLLRTAPGKFFVSRLFVRYFTRQTLLHLKRYLEEGGAGVLNEELSPEWERLRLSA